MFIAYFSERFETSRFISELLFPSQQWGAILCELKKSSPMYEKGSERTVQWGAISIHREQTVWQGRGGGNPSECGNQPALVFCCLEHSSQWSGLQCPWQPAIPTHPSLRLGLWGFICPISEQLLCISWGH